LWTAGALACARESFVAQALLPVETKKIRSQISTISISATKNLRPSAEQGLLKRVSFPKSNKQMLARASAAQT
jgi:hypothetical protein